MLTDEEAEAIRKGVADGWRGPKVLAEDHRCEDVVRVAPAEVDEERVAGRTVLILPCMTASPDP